MTPQEMLAREILRLDARDPMNDDERFNEESWPSSGAVRVALRIVAEADRAKASLWDRGVWDARTA